MKFWTIDEILEEEMKTPGFAERFERAGQEIEAEFAAERLHAERAQMFFSRYKKQRNTKRPFALHRTRVRATA